MSLPTDKPQLARASQPSPPVARRRALVRPMRADEASGVAELLAISMADDPFVRWISQGEHDRAVRWMTAGVTMGRRHGAVLVDTSVSGAILLVEPGGLPLAPLENLRLLPALVRTVGARRLVRVLRGLTALDVAHPAEPHWTILVLGVQPAQRGAGIGHELIHSSLAAIGRTAVYLEVSPSGPLDLYRRHGFAIRDRVELGRGTPTMMTMWRAASP